jgi:hypothetical protein
VTPLIFTGTKGAKLRQEPRVNYTEGELGRSGPAGEEGKKEENKKGEQVGESGMYAGGHFNLEKNYATFEWEENEKDIDRAWYDCDEIGNVNYGNDQYDLGNPLQGTLPPLILQVALRPRRRRRANSSSKSDSPSRDRRPTTPRATSGICTSFGPQGS